MLAYILGITKRGNKGIQIGAGFRDCKSRQEELQVWAA